MFGMTYLAQGTFNASYSGANPNPGNATNQAGDAQIIQIPSGTDFIYAYNFTKAGANGLNTVYFNGNNNAFAGYEFFWQLGMPQGSALVKYKANGAATVDQDVLLTGGFSVYDPSGQNPLALPLFSAPVATTATTNATQPVVSTGNTAGLGVGSIVRMSSTAQTDVNGVDMVVSAVTANTNFTLLFAGNALATAPGAIGGAGFYRIVNYDPLFYPRRRYITNITRAANAQVSVSVPHQYVVGQAVRFFIPSISGMVELNPSASNNLLYGTIVSVVDTYNFTVNINTTNFTAFTFPTIAQMPNSFPIVVPVGEDTATALVSAANQVPVGLNNQLIFNAASGILSDATVNTGVLGMVFGSGGNGTALGTPITGPAGTVHFTAGDVIDARDVMYWYAGKSAFGGQ